MRFHFLPVVFIACVVHAQNLAPNNSFETYSPAPTDYAQTCRATGWSSATGACVLVVGSGSPDYYNTAGSGGAKPPATWWGTVNPHTGEGMCGLAPWYATSSNYREYIRCQLTAPLVVGTNYEVSMWLSNGSSTIHGYGCNNIGVYFSSAQTNQSGGSPITSVTPQCELATIFWNTSWQKVTFYYTPTTAYQYMCIGNFRNDAGTTAAMYGAGTSGCYVYIDDVIVQPFIPLPIKLTLFTAKANSNQTVSLNWETSSELNNDYFSIERATDAMHFETIGKVAGNGTTTEAHEYFSVDQDPANGYNYYRLNQVDFDGTQTYSQIVAVEMNSVNGECRVIVFPNPAKMNGSISFLIAGSDDLPSEIWVANIDGSVVLKKKIITSDNANPIMLQLNQLQPGMYFIQVITTSSQMLTQKFLIE